jgi:addiction module HigA family antidote
MRENESAPVTPGEMLKEEFLAAYGLSQNRLAKAIGISPNRIAEIVNNAGGASRRIRHCGSACTSAIARSSG